MYDIAIVGAGPAGSTLARLIGKNYRVLLIDKKQHVDLSKTVSKGKCCGGLLAPDAQKMLSKLGLGLPKSVLEDPQLFVVRAIDIGQRLEKFYQRHYINMDRRKFDHWLLSMVPSGVDVRPGCKLNSYTAGKGSFDIVLAQDNKTYNEKARILIGADGASSKVRQQLIPNHLNPKKYIAIQEWVNVGYRLPYFSSIFDPEITDYYGWTIPKGELLIIGAALLAHQQPSEKFMLLKSKLRNYGFEFGKTVWREGAIILRPTRMHQLSTGSKGIALIGEAAGWISPSSAEGLSYALKSALYLAEALNSSLNGFEKHYFKKSRPLRNTIFLKNLKSYVLFDPRLRRAVMKSGVESVAVQGVN